MAKVVTLNESQNKVTLTATLNERRGVDLAFRVGGPLVYLNNVVGSYVKKGDVVASIDERDFKVGLQKAESNYKLSKNEYERYHELLKQNSVSQSVFDRIEAQYILAKGNYEDARHAFEDTQLRAPYSGYIDRVNVENYQKVAPGQPIAYFIDMSSYKVTSWVSVEDAQSVGEDTRFTCVIKDADSTYRFNAKLLELGSKASFTKQSYPLSVVLEDVEGLKLRAGMSILLEMYNQSESASSSSVVPVTALFAQGEQSCVWVLKDNQVERRNVVVEKILSDSEALVQNGVKPGELVVSAGANYLREGQKVEIYKGFSKTNKGNQL